MEEPNIGHSSDVSLHRAPPNIVRIST